MEVEGAYHQFGAVVAGVGLWQFLVSAGVISATVLPPPSALAEATVILLAEERFQTHLFETLRRTVIASAVATTAGVGLGLAMGWSKRLRFVFSPPLSALYPLPVVALLPLVILVLGTTERAMLFTAALGGFYLAVWNSMNGARSIEEVYFEVARDNGVTSTYRLFREVLFPGALPLVFTGLRLCLSTVLLIIISVEFITLDSGVGYFLWLSWNTYSLPDLYAAVLIIGFIGVGITYGLKHLQAFLMPWQPDISRPLRT